MVIKVLYFLSFFAAIFSIFVCAHKNRVQNILPILLACTIAVSNFGYAFLTTCTNQESAMLCNNLTYLGGVFLPLIMVFVSADVCKTRINKFLGAALILFAAVLLSLSFSASYTSIYYRNIQFYMDNQVGYLVKEYGPAHCLYFIYLFIILFISLGLLCNGFKRRNQVSVSTMIILLSSESVSIFIYVLERMLHSKFDYLSIIYVILVLYINALNKRISTYNVKSNVLYSSDKMQEIGYIAFDKKNRYVDSNELARHYFPELKDMHVDNYLKENKCSPLLNNMIEWVRSEPGEDEEKILCINEDNKIFRFTVREIRNEINDRYAGHILEFKDVTDKENEITKLDRLVKDRTKRIEKIRESYVLGLATAIESRDNTTGGHIRRTKEVVKIFADRLVYENFDYYITRNFLDLVEKAAPMHDIGKIHVDDSILKKDSALTPEEFEQMKNHTTEGARILEEMFDGVEEIEFVKVVSSVARYHHEHWDGSGYPEGLSGMSIPLEARIVAFADSFDAMASARRYKNRYTYDKIFKEILEGIGSQFDPLLGRIFLNCRAELEAFYDQEYRNNKML